VKSSALSERVPARTCFSWPRGARFARNSNAPLARRVSLMPFRRSVSWRPLSRRLIAAGAILAYLAAAFGLPLPPPAVIKDGGKPFMCQGQACGCQTAEECWRHCCCHTPEERWAWAAEHDVTPPDYAEKPTAKTPPKRDPAGDAIVSALVDLSAPADTVAAQADSCAPTEADHDACCSCCKDDGSRGMRRALTSTLLRGCVVSPLRCQGLTTQWVTTGVVPTQPPTHTHRPEAAATGRLFLANFFARRVAQSPPFHPPRFPFSA
jgi:hypothetical protein